MKNILSIVLALFITSACFAQQETLALNLVNGTTYKQRTNAEMELVQSVNGQDITINMNITGIMDYKVIAVADSVYTIEVRYTNLGMKMGLPTGEVAFSTDSSDPNDVFSTVMKGMTKNFFTIKMSKRGKILEVKNADNLFNGIPAIEQLPEAQQKQIKSQISQSYGEKAFKGNIEMSMAIFPSTKVAKGNQWQVKGKLESGMSADLLTTYTLSDVTPEHYIITGVSKVTDMNNDNFVESNGMMIKTSLSGKMSSTIKIDKKTGWIAEATINQDLAGNAEIKDNPQIPGGMTLPMTMSGKTVLTDK